MFGMHTVIIGNATEFDTALADADKKGLRLSCVSNIGPGGPLPDNKRRLTFLPHSAFTDSEK